jgi:predicted secreted protein
MKLPGKLKKLKSHFIKTSDQRSFKLVVAIDCILNQNSRDFGAATYPSMNKDVLHLCMKYDVGIFQIPCPEMAFLGLLRERKPGQSIRNALDTKAGREFCRKLSIEMVNRIQDYLKNNNKILAVLGGNPESPGCAIHTEQSNKDTQSLTEESGIFMKEFHKELLKRNIQIPFRGIRDCKAEWIKEDLEWLEQVFANA